MPTGDILTTTADNWLTISASIADGTDDDFFSFTLGAASGVFFDIDSRDVGLSNSLDSQLRLYNSVGGAAIANDDDGYDFEGFDQPAASTGDATSLDSSLYRDLGAGTYWVQVDGVGATTGDYYLRILADTDYAAAVPVFNSNAGATDTLYLDFDGHASNGDTWVVDNGNTPYAAVAFDLNGNAGQFSPGERLAMQNLWRTTSEDLSPFNMNVTTVNPGGFANGVAYRQVVTNSDGPIVGQAAGIFGVAYVGSYNGGGVNTGFTFAANFGAYSGGVSGSIMVASFEQGNTSTHEPGHAFTLRHFNTAPPGPGSVIPNGIMATPDQGFNREVWSNGTNTQGNPQNDLNIIGNVGTNAIGVRADDHGNTTGTATAMSYDPAAKRHSATGIIERLNTDVDFFSFQVFDSSGPIQIRADVDEYINDLDTELRVFHSSGTLLGTADPNDSFDAELSLNLAPGTYFAEVRSDGQDGEIGQYSITVDEQDRFEKNDTLATATVLGSEQKITLRDLTIHDDKDVDYFQITAQDTGKLVINMFFPHADGNLDMQVRDGHDNVIASSLSVTDNEELVIPVVSQERYFLKVFGAVGNTNVYDLEIENFPAPIPTGAFLDPASDTGRSNADNITKNNRPQLFIQDDVLQFVDTNNNDTRDPTEIRALTAAQANAAVTSGAAVQVWLTNTTTRTTVKGYADPLDANNPVFYSFTPAAALADGTYLVSAATWIFDDQADAVGSPSPASGRTQLSTPLLPVLHFTVDTQAPTVTITGIDPATSDTGVEGQPATFADNITSDTATGFAGTAEADAIVRMWADGAPVSAGVINGSDVYQGLTVAVPLDGNLAFLNGQWNLAGKFDLNDPTAGFPLDGRRQIVVTAEDLAGNESSRAQPDAAAVLDIFIDTQGPQVFDPDGAGAEQAIQITGSPNYNLFGLKPDNAPEGPTPLVDSLTINVRDLPLRVTDFLYGALADGAGGNPAENPGHYLLVGDANGIIPITAVIVTNAAPVNGGQATATIELQFAEPLPDDRFTLTVKDDVVDVAGNRFDGESNANEPNGGPNFPSGDGVPGGDFVARFTVDSRAEIGVWSAGSVYVDTNGNFSFDPDNVDHTNRDLVYTLGYTSDYVFAGNFALNRGDTADGFDKLAAYGFVGGVGRWLVDTDNDGVPNVDKADPASVIGMPVAGEFDGIPANGDEVGLFNGTRWFLDRNHNYRVNDDVPITTSYMTGGYPIVGDFDGDTLDDLATYNAGVFTFDLAVDGLGDAFEVTWDAQFNFNYLGFIGVRERPVAADMDGDGIDDIGLWVPDRSGVLPETGGEWYFLISNDLAKTERITGQVNTLDHHFSPIPLGNDLFAQFGDEFAVPVVGNFDPPVAGEGVAQGHAVLGLLGTPEPDVLVFTAGSTPGSWTVTLNDVPQDDVSGDTITLDFDGLGGNDTVTLTGSGGADRADLWPGHGTLSGEGYSVAVANVESVTINGGGGTDVAALRDNPAGKDTFTADPDAATLSGDGYSNQVVSFRYVHAFSTSGDSDTAYLHDDPNGDDTLKAGPTEAKLYGGDYYIRAKSFRDVYAYGTPGDKDVAALVGNPNGIDTFLAYPDVATLSGAGYSNQAASFGYVQARGTPGNDDVAYLHDDPDGYDILKAWPAKAKLYGEYYQNRALSFGNVYAYSTPGNSDVAVLVDSSGNDTFEAWPKMARLSGADFSNQVESFRSVHAYARAGGTDEAWFYGSAEKDRFVATSKFSKLGGTDFSNRAVSFEQVYAYGGGGRDVAVIYDAVLEAGITDPPPSVAVAWLHEFARLRLRSTEPGSDDTIINAVDQVFTGYWE
ncbi:MAG: hypothetical protein ABIP48_08270 [Planctomycetota bacterium]